MWLRTLCYVPFLSFFFKGIQKVGRSSGSLLSKPFTDWAFFQELFTDQCAVALS